MSSNLIAGSIIVSLTDGQQKFQDLLTVIKEAKTRCQRKNSIEVSRT